MNMNIEQEAVSLSTDFRLSLTMWLGLVVYVG